MKKLLLILLPLLLFCADCFSTTEEISIQQNGSGLYGVTLDMSGIFDFIESMAGGQMPDDAAKELKQERDTLIRFSSFTDTSTKLTAEEKALMRDATMHMVMKEKEKKFLMEMRFPFKKMEDVNRITALMQQQGNMLGKVLGAPETPGEEQAAQPPTPDLNSYYDLTFKQGLVEKKVNPEKLKQFQEHPQYEQMKQASGMFTDAKISTVIRLPQRAKKVEGANAKTSDDGKTITIAVPFADALENPDAMAFHIEY